MTYQDRITKIGNLLKGLGVKCDIIQAGTYGIFISHDKDSSYYLNKILRDAAKKINQSLNEPAWVTSSKLSDNSKLFILSFIGEKQKFNVKQVIRDLRLQA